MTESNNGNPMLWPTLDEALTYCGEDEKPIELYVQADIDGLRRQLSAAKIIIEGLERLAIEHGAERRALAAAAADVTGERAANAVLTAENERLTKYAAHCDSLIAVYKGVIAGDKSRATPLPGDPNNQHAINVPGFGWVAVKAVRAIERAHGIG